MNTEFLNLVAMTADAEQRATATLIEMIAATALLKLNPPVNAVDTVTLEISQADLSEMMESHRYVTSYDDAGTMTISLTPIRD